MWWQVLHIRLYGIGTNNLGFMGMQIKRIFRYGYSTLCVLVGMIVSFFVFNYYHSAKQIDINEKADREKYHYNYELAVMVSGDSFESDTLNYDYI